LENPWEVFVHLAYLDDAGTEKPNSSIVMCGAVIISPDVWGGVENLHSTAISDIIPVEEIDEKFQEFHATELFNGDGPFKGIDQQKCFNAIRTLLTAVVLGKLSYIYAAVDRAKLKKSPMGSANPLDVAFRFCALGIEDWARGQHVQYPGATTKRNYKDMCLFIFGDTDDKQLKNQLRTSYRARRTAHRYLRPTEGRPWHAHDDMYFGDSRDSIGIQMADLCNYFMWRHLLKKNGTEEFYRLFQANAVCAKPEPEWSVYRDLFVTHEGNDLKPVVELKPAAKAKGQSG